MYYPLRRIYSGFAFLLSIFRSYSAIKICLQKQQVYHLSKNMTFGKSEKLNTNPPSSQSLKSHLRHSSCLRPLGFSIDGFISLIKMCWVSCCHTLHNIIDKIEKFSRAIDREVDPLKKVNILLRIFTKLRWLLLIGELSGFSTCLGR